MGGRKKAQEAQKIDVFAPFVPLCGQFAFTVCSPSCGLLSNMLFYVIL